MAKLLEDPTCKLSEGNVPFQSFPGQFKIAKAIWNKRITRRDDLQVDSKLAATILSKK